MGEATAIAWTDHTFNPWWGCTKIAAPDGERSACDHCYAAGNANRWGFDIWGKDAARRFFGDKHWAEPLKWERVAVAGEPGPNTGRADHLVFCASMADVFEARDDLDEHRARLWALIEATPHLMWLLLTKRPEQMPRRVPPSWAAGWPANVWAGTTVEDQRAADLRIPRLLSVPAPVRFLSVEPLFGEVDLRLRPDGVPVNEWGIPLGRCGYYCERGNPHGHHDHSDRLGWVIVGGESGPGYQALDLEHARSVRDQCLAAGVPLFFKQIGGRTPKAGGDLLDGVEWKQFPEPGS